MELIKDIFINLLSDALWAIGGFIIARLLLLKKFSSFRYDTKKSIVCPVYRDNSQKKIYLGIYKILPV